MKTRMKKLTALMMAAAMTTGTVMPVTADAGQKEKAVEKEFYVSVKGNDKNDGSKESPFKTVERARQEVDKFNDNMTGDIIVNIGAGDYYLDETLQFDEEDSGTNGHEVIYRCTEELGGARLHGGKKITGEWETADASDVALGLRPEVQDKVYKTKLDPEEFQFNTLYVNDERAVMARTKNYEYNKYFPIARGGYLNAAGGNATQLNMGSGVDEASIKGMQLAQDRGEAEIAQVFVWPGSGWGSVWNWFTDTVPIGKMEGNVLKYQTVEGHPELNRGKYGVAGGSRYVLQGNIGFLDVEGEYFYHKPTGTLYYYPKEKDGAIEDQTIVAPKMMEAVRFKGADKEHTGAEPDSEKQVHNITLYGLTVMDTDFPTYYSSSWTSFGESSQLSYFPEEALEEGITNPSYCEMTERPQFQVGAINLKDTNHITIDSSIIRNAGLNGVSMYGDNEYNVIQNCEFKNIGFNGIVTDGGYPGVGKYNNHHTMQNLLIHDVGELVGSAAGVAVQQSGYNLVSHVEVYNSPRRGMFLSGAWWKRHTSHAGTGCPVDKGGAADTCALDTFERMNDAYTFENDFEYIYVHDCEQEGTDDGAFFMCTLYRQEDMTIKGSKPNRLNQVVIGDIAANPEVTADWKPSNMNLDMGCSGVELRNVKSVNPQQLNIRGGEDIAVMDNVNYFHVISTFPDSKDMWKTFDDSKMEYDKIGVTEDFPFGGRPQAEEKTYEDVYFRDEFDNGLAEWWSMSGKTETSPVYFSDANRMHGNSFRADSCWNKAADGNAKGTNIKRPFGVELNKIVEVDFFDRTLTGTDAGIWNGVGQDIGLDAFARVDDGINTRGIGVNTDQDFNHYMYEVGDLKFSTNIRRTAGWHTFKWDYTSEKEVKMYIDDELIATVPYLTSFNTIRVGDFSGRGMTYFDNVVVYGGEDAGKLLPLPPKDDESGETEEVRASFPGKIEAEDTDKVTGTGRPAEVTGGGQCLGYIGTGDKYEYNIEITEAVELPLQIRYAANGNGKIRVTIGEQIQDIALANTGGWQNWKTLTTTQNFKLEPGETKLTIDVLQNNINLDWYEIEKKKEPVAVEAVLPVVDGTLILAEGDSVKIPCRVLPENADNKNVTWSTENDGSVLTVAQDGTIHAAGSGNASVKVTSQENADVMAEFEVEVRDTESSLVSTTENGCTPEVSSKWDERYGAATLIDGSLNTEWASCSPGYTDPEPTAKLTWAEPQTVKTIYAYDRPNGNDWTKEVEVIFNDDETSKKVIKNIENDGKTPGILTLEQPEQNVTSVKIIIPRDKNGEGALGLSEVKVFSEVPGNIPVNGIAFDKEQKDLFVGGSFDLALPQVIPSTATDSSYQLKVEEGADVIKVTENSWDGVLFNYKVEALKEGTAVITATASNGKKAELVVNVLTKDDLLAAIMEAEALYSKVPGATAYHKQLKTAIKSASAAYNSANLSIEVMSSELEKLNKAMEAMETALEEETDQDIDKIVNGLKIKAPELGANRIELPEVPFGYKVEISNVSPAGIIYKNGVMVTPDVDTDVVVTLKVTRIHDGEMRTGKIAVTVKGVSCEALLENMTIENPAEGAKKLKLPSVPNGFDIAFVKSSDEAIIDLDGNIYAPLNNTDVKITVEVSKRSNGTKAQREFTVTVAGTARPAEGKFEAESYAEQQGMIPNSVGLGNIDNGDWVRYSDIYFGDKERLYEITLNMGIDPGYTGGTFTFKLDSLDGETVGSIKFTSTGGFEIFGEQSATFTKAIKGSHDLYMLAGGRNSGVGNFDWFKLKDVTPAGPADYAEVDAAIAEAEKLVEDLYTADSWKQLQDAIDAVVRDLTEKEQEQVDAFAAAINIAIDNLVQAPEKKTFTITVDGTSTEYGYNKPVTITTPAEKDGVKFAYWMAADGTIISYEAEYKFYASKDITFTAVYEDGVDEAAQAVLTNVFVTKRDDGKSDVKFVGELTVPEGYTVVEAGLVWSSKDTALVVDDAPNTALKSTLISKISDTNQFSVTIKGMPKDKFLRGVIFAKVVDQDGNEIYIFSAEKKAYAAK